MKQIKIIGNTPSLNCEPVPDLNNATSEAYNPQSNNFIASLLFSRIMERDSHSDQIHNDRSEIRNSDRESSSSNDSQEGFGGGFGGGDFGGGGAGSSW